MAKQNQTPTFKKGTKVDLFVTSVQATGRFCHFWAQTDIGRALEVENLMTEVESNVVNVRAPQIVHKGELCLAKFREDLKWYRGKVVDSCPQGSRSHAQVFFLDYGNTEVVPLSDLRINQLDYFAIPPQSKEFVLADLIPRDGVRWSRGEVDHLRDNLVYGEFSGHVLATVCGKIPLIRLMSGADKTQPLVSKFPSAGIGKSYNNVHFLQSEYFQQPLPLSVELEVFVTYSLSPVKFWIQLENAEDELAKLRSQMENYYHSLSEKELRCNIDDGTLCAGICSIDGSFYRAVIEECRTDGQCRTFFIDYGNCETSGVQNFQFKTLPDEFKTIPAHAYECTLFGIPGGMNMTDSHIAIFRDLVNDVIVKAKFCSVDLDGIYTVELSDMNGNSIVDIMKLGSVKPLPKTVPPAPVTQKPQVPPPDCTVGTEEEVFITMAESPERFFGQLCKYSGEDLDEFQNNMMEHYEAYYSRIPSLSTPAVGDLCCAKYSSDDSWYRAQVDAMDKNRLDLFFIDYGDMQKDVPVAEVKVLDPKFLNLPQQGILLKMVTPVDTSKFKEIIDRRVFLQLEKDLGSRCFSATLSPKNEANVLKLILEPEAPKQSSRSTKAKMPKARYKEVIVEPNGSESVTVSHVTSPESFYCQFTKTEDKLDTMMDDIYNFYSALEPTEFILQNPAVGSPCIAKYTTDDGWYRATVAGSGKQGDSIKVFYVDYGNSEVVPMDRVRTIDTRFLNLAAQAVHCTMLDINYRDAWPPECNAQFEEMVKDGCTASFLGFDENRLAYETELLDVNGGNINDKFGKATHTAVRTLPPQPVQSRVPPALQQRVQAVVPAAMPPSAQMKTPMSPPRRPPGIMYQRIDVPVGVFKDVMVVHIENPGEFYCQLMQSAPALSELMEKLDSVYTKLGPTDCSVRNPVKGMPCCAKFTEDDIWYRAEVTEVLGNILTVQFVDYGNGETLSCERVKELKPDILQLPAQAVKCCLKGVQPNDGEWTDTIIDKFIDLTDEKSLVGSVITKLPDGTLEMELLDTETGGDLNIGRELAKLARTGGSAAVPNAQQANALRSRSSSGSSSGTGSKLYPRTSSPPRQKTLPKEQSYGAERTKAFVADRSGGNKSGFKPRQPSAASDWPEDPSGPRFLDRMAGGDEEKSHQGSEWPGERREKKRGGGDSGSNFSSSNDDWRNGPSTGSSFGAQKQERSSGGFGSKKSNFGESRSFSNQSEDTTPLPPYKDISLSKGEKHTVLITWSENPCEFWCQLVDNQDQIGKMMREIQAEYNRNKSQYSLSSSSTGTPCIAQYYADQAWYRGKIVTTDFGSYKVLFVDYGNQETVEKNNVKRMKVDFMSLPCQAIRCQLKGLDAVSKSWTQDSKTKYQRIMDGKPLDCVFQEGGETHQVELDVAQKLVQAGLVSSRGGTKATPTYTSAPAAAQEKKYPMQSKTGRHVGFISHVDTPGKFFVQLKNEEALVGKLSDDLATLCEGPGAGQLKLSKMPAVGTACIAKFADDGSHYRAVVESITGTKAAVRFVDFGNAENVDLTEMLDIKGTLLQQCPLAYECTLVPGSTWKESDADLLHNTTVEKELGIEFTSNRPPFTVKLFDQQTDIGSQFTPESVAKTGYPARTLGSQSATGYVSHIENLNQFYVQLESEENELQTMADEVQGSYEGNSSPLSNVTSGSPCAARFSEDNLWYRAVITTVSGSRASVRFVDYGNGEEVDVQNLKELKPELSNKSPFALECRLLTDESSQASIDKFGEMTADKALAIHFSTNSPPYIVRVMDGSNNIGAQFAEKAAPPAPTTKSFPQPTQSFPQPVISCKKTEVYVSHIENPDHFFVQYASDSGKLEQITATLVEQALERLPQISSPTFGTACIAEFSEDNALYRAVVKKMESGKVTVLFVDFGNTDELPLAKIRGVPTALLQTPPLAIHCTLGTGQDWPADKIDEFSTTVMDVPANVEFLNCTQPCTVKIEVDGEDIGKKLGVESKQMYPAPVYPQGRQAAYTSHVESIKKFHIHLTANEDALQTLTEILEASCDGWQKVDNVAPGMPCAGKFSEDEAWYRAEVIECLPGGKVKLLFVDFGNTDTVGMDDLRLLPAEHISKTFAFECRLEEGVNDSQENNGKFDESVTDQDLEVEFLTSAKPAKVRVYIGGKDITEMLAKDAVQTDMPQYPAYTLTNLEQKVAVVHVDSPGQFYVQILSDEAKLNKLMDELDTFYSSTGKVLTNVSEDVPCVTKYSVDEGWYRGKVTAKCAGVATVQFVDYGNCEDKPVGQIYALDQQFANIPPLALECTLTNQNYSSEEMEKFRTLTADKELDAVFQSQTLPFSIQLFESGKDITAEFVAAKSPASTPTKKIPKQDISLGKHKGYISHVESLDHFYVQLEREENDLNAMADKLDIVYKKPDGAEALENIVEGVQCATLFSADSHWYRGKIVGVGHDIATVHFIDYGNSEDQPQSSIKVLVEEFTTHPPLAYKCTLGSNVVFTPEDSDAFTELTAEKLLDIEFLMSTSPHVVKVFEGSECLSALYLQGEPVVETPAPKEIIAESAISKQFKYPLHMRPEESKSVEVFVTTVKSPGQFWCQESSCEGPVNTLSDKINADESLKCRTLTINDVHIGAAYLAKFSDDDLWYRATVLTMQDTDCSVLFVDYGNQEKVVYDHLYPIADEYLVQEAFSFECGLSGVESNGGKWGTDAVEKFSEIVMDQNLTLSFQSTSSSTLGEGLQKYGVLLVCDGKDVAETLIEAEVARLPSTDVDQVREEPETSADTSSSVELHYTEVDISACDKCEVTVSFVTSPSQFWVQMKNTQEKLDNIMAVIEGEYSELGEHDLALTSPRVDQPCLVKYSEDDTWYRGQILKVLEDNQVEVHFVDYGNSEVTDLTKVKSMKPSLVELPMQAVECFHAGIKSVEGPWSEEAITVFSDLVHCKTLVSEFLSIEKDCDNPNIVHLRDMGMSLVDKMVEAGVAEKTDLALSTFLDVSVVEPTDSGDITEAVSPEVETVTEVETTAESNAVKFTMPKLTVGSTVDVFVTSITDPSDFWCQLADSSEDLPLLMDSFHEYCHDNEEAKLKDDLTISLPCIACTQDGDDEAWYRARIIQTLENEVEVCFVDYGNVEKVSKDKLYKLQPEHTELPLQAFRCTLKDIKPIGESWDPSACTRLEELTYDKKLKLQISAAKCEDKVVTSVSGTLEDDSESIMNKLIDEGYAEVRKQDEEEGFASAEEEDAVAASEGAEQEGGAAEPENLNESDEFHDAEAASENLEEVESEAKCVQEETGAGKESEEGEDFADAVAEMDEAHEAIMVLDEVLKDQDGEKPVEDEVEASGQDQDEVEAVEVQEEASTQDQGEETSEGQEQETSVEDQEVTLTEDQQEETLDQDQDKETSGKDQENETSTRDQEEKISIQDKEETSVQDQETSVQDQETSVQEQETSVQDQETSVQDQETSVQDQETSVQDQETSVQDQGETSVQDQETSVQEQETSVQGQEMSVQDQETSVQDQETSVQDQETSVQDQEETSVQDQEETSVQDQEETSVQDHETSVQGQETSVKDQEETQVQDNEETSVQDLEETSVQDQETSVQDQEETSVQDQEETQVQDQEETSVQLQEETHVQDQEETSVQDQEETSVQDQEETQVQDQEETQVQDKEETSVQDQEKMSDQEDRAQAQEILVEVQEETSAVDQEDTSIQDQGNEIGVEVCEESPVKEEDQTEKEAEMFDKDEEANKEETGIASDDVDEESEVQLAEDRKEVSADVENESKEAEVEVQCSSEQEALVESDGDESQEGEMAEPETALEEEPRETSAGVESEDVVMKEKPDEQETQAELVDSGAGVEEMEKVEDESESAEVDGDEGETENAQDEADKTEGIVDETEGGGAAEEDLETEYQEVARKTVHDALESAKQIIRRESEESIASVEVEEKSAPKITCMQLEEDAKVVVAFVRGVSPSDFYLQPKSSTSYLEELAEKISAVCQAEDDVPESSHGVDEVCLARNADGQWCRARIQSVEEENYKVFFLDNGADGVVTSENLRSIPDELTQLPCHVIKCQLDGLKECSWSSEIVETFLAMCQEKLCCRFVREIANGHYSVYLYNSEGEEAVSVNTLLATAFDLEIIPGTELEIEMEVAIDSDGEKEMSFQEVRAERYSSLGSLPGGVPVVNGDFQGCSSTPAEAQVNGEVAEDVKGKNVKEPQVEEPQAEEDQVEV